MEDLTASLKTSVVHREGGEQELAKFEVESTANTLGAASETEVTKEGEVGVGMNELKEAEQGRALAERKARAMKVGLFTQGYGLVALLGGCPPPPLLACTFPSKCLSVLSDCVGGIGGSHWTSQGAKGGLGGKSFETIE